MLVCCVSAAAWQVRSYPQIDHLVLIFNSWNSPLIINVTVYTAGPAGCDSVPYRLYRTEIFNVTHENIVENLKPFTRYSVTLTNGTGFFRVINFTTMVGKLMKPDVLVIIQLSCVQPEFRNSVVK